MNDDYLCCTNCYVEIVGYSLCILSHLIRNIEHDRIIEYSITTVVGFC